MQKLHMQKLHPKDLISKNMCTIAKIASISCKKFQPKSSAALIQLFSALWLYYRCYDLQCILRIDFALSK